MTTLLRHPATPVAILLIAATSLSWWLGAGFSNGIAVDYRYISTTLLLIAFVKVRFVIRHFMEVCTAPLALRMISDAWVIGVCGAIIALYWFGPVY